MRAPWRACTWLFPVFTSRLRDNIALLRRKRVRNSYTKHTTRAGTLLRAGRDKYSIFPIVLITCASTCAQIASILLRRTMRYQLGSFRQPFRRVIGRAGGKFFGKFEYTTISCVDLLFDVFGEDLSSDIHIHISQRLSRCENHV